MAEGVGGGGGGGVLARYWFKSLLRYKDDGSYGYSCSEY